MTNAPSAISPITQRGDRSAPPGAPPPVLSTLNPDGSRRWIKPRPSNGPWLTRRRIVAYLLILIFTAIPYLSMNGKPLILLDIPTRHFTFFGFTFLPTDTLLLAVFIVTVFVSIFLLTALFGRVWCGWACPQTVYMEFLYRPIERLFEGTPGRAKANAFIASPAAKAVKWLVYVLAAFFLAHTFLAYFVGVENLRHWVLGSPADHPAGFLVVIAVTALMLFDFGFFREQVCLVACPYGRFQSVMLDRRSKIVAYDAPRGEPRGKSRAADVALPQAPPARGDCIDCLMCVHTCPTGIDIRNGLQMECVHCTQCIDACDTVMEKIGKPRGLIRYSSQAELAGETVRRARPRIFVYAGIITLLAALFITLLVTKPPADVIVLRARGAPFVIADDGLVSNSVNVRITNRTSAPASYTLSVRADAAVLRAEDTVVRLDPGKSATVPARILAPPSAFQHGRLEVHVAVTEAGGFTTQAPFRLMGPAQNAGGKP